MKGFMIRRISTIAAVVILVGAFALSKQLAAMKEPPKEDPQVKQVTLVEVLKVSNGAVPGQIDVNGRLLAREKINVVSEVSGRLLASRRQFKEGVAFRKGETLFRLDDTDFRLSLVATRSGFQSLLTQLLTDLKIDYPDNFSNWKAYVDNFDPAKSLPALPQVSSAQEKGYLVAKNVYNQYYNIQSQEAKLRKYTFRAPFSGVVDKASINPGSMVAAGQNLGAFLNNQNFELEAGVNIAQVGNVTVGNTVRLTSPDIAGEWEGTVRRISKSIDPATQNVTAYIQVKGNELREGMYLRGTIGDGTIENATVIPRKLLVGGDQVYTIQDSVLKLTTVNVVRESGSEAIVKGLPNNTLLLNSEVSGVYEGMKVKQNVAP